MRLSLVGLALVAALPLLAGSQPESACPGWPSLIVVGTVIELQGPRKICRQVASPVSPDMCGESGIVMCNAPPSATLQHLGEAPRSLELAPPEVPSPNAGVFRICDLGPGAYDLALCPDDDTPVRCRIEARDGRTVGVRVATEPSEPQVKVRVESVEFGHAGSEVAFSTYVQPMPVLGERRRFELQEVGVLTTDGVDRSLIEWPCYQAHAPAGRHGCAGCNAGGTGAWGAFAILAALAVLRTRRR